MLGESSTAIERCRSDVVPRKKFVFSSRRALPQSVEQPQEREPREVGTASPSTDAEICGTLSVGEENEINNVKERSDEIIIIGGELASAGARDFRLTKLVDCVIVM
jgi:hypothetical protein